MAKSARAPICRFESYLLPLPKKWEEEMLLELVRACFFDILGDQPMALARDQIMAHQGVKVVHILFEGRSLDVPQDDLDVGDASSDNEIKRAITNGISREIHVRSATSPSLRPPGRSIA